MEEKGEVKLKEELDQQELEFLAKVRMAQLLDVAVEEASMEEEVRIAGEEVVALDILEELRMDLPLQVAIQVMAKQE